MKAKKTARKRGPLRSGPRSIAVLCSGGDAPGMNAAVRAVVRCAIFHGLDVYGVYKGYTGLLEGTFEKMNLRSVANIIQRGGTILKTDRCQAFFQKSARAEAVHILRRKKIDALVVIGGEGSYTGAHLMQKENGFKVVGIPGTIDNDVYGSEYTIGFDTAVNTALDAIDKIRDTASAHDRVFLVEVMGRTSAEIAMRVGVSGGAETIVVPGKTNAAIIDDLARSLKKSAAAGKLSSIVVVAESGHPEFTTQLALDLRAKHGIDPRVAILGYLQRGGTPTAQDRYMASLMGAHAVDALVNGKSNLSIGVVNGAIAEIPLRKTVGRHKKADHALLKLAAILAS
ncbi:MAG: 6-phosphofructokinase [Deltaproteobacteria bacterium]|nr:6-phosphofructokinase [Deltaproteobacteria bacterium]